jgi:hypothetical protein
MESRLMPEKAGCVFTVTTLLNLLVAETTFVLRKMDSLPLSSTHETRTLPLPKSKTLGVLAVAAETVATVIFFMPVTAEVAEAGGTIVRARTIATRADKTFFIRTPYVFRLVPIIAITNRWLR